MSDKEDIILDENKYTQVDEKIRVPFFKRWWVKFLLGFLLVVVLFNITDKHYMEDNYLDVEWEKLELGKVLPKPDIEFKTKVDKNTKEQLKLSLYEFDKNSYNEYINKIKEAGFDIEPVQNDEDYLAYNNEDYELKVKLEYDLLEIDLNRLKVLNEFIWPEIGPATKLPKPNTNVGVIERDSSSSFVAVLGEMSQMQFDEYVEQCKKNGFNIDFIKDEKVFQAENDKGDLLKIRRTPVNRVNINLDVVDNTEVLINNQNKVENNAANNTVNNTVTNGNKPQIKDSRNNTTNTAAKETAGKLRPEFKAKMDQYEAFIEDYVKFVDRFLASDGKDVNLIKEYSDYMDKMMKFTEEFKKIDDMQLTQDEIDYFLKLDKELTDKVNKAVNKIK